MKFKVLLDFFLDLPRGSGLCYNRRGNDLRRDQFLRSFSRPENICNFKKFLF